MQAEPLILDDKLSQLESNPQLDGVRIVRVINNYCLNTNIEKYQSCSIYMLPNQTFIKTNGFNVSNMEQFDSRGQLIKRNPMQDTLQASIISFEIVTECLALIPCTSPQLPNRYMVYQWNFITGETKYLIYQMMRSKNTYSRLIFKIFPMSNLCCIIEYLESKQVQLKVSYYSYPLQGKDDKPTHVYHTIKAPFKNIESIWQLNYNSGVAFVGGDQSAQCNKIYICDLNTAQQKNSNLQLLTIQTPFKFSPQFLFCKLVELWEPKPGMLYINYSLEANDHALSTKLRNKYGQKAKGQSIKKVIISQQNRQKAYQAAKLQYAKQRHYHMIWAENENKFIEIELPQNKFKDHNVQIQFSSGFRRQTMNYTTQKSLYGRLMLDVGSYKVESSSYRKLDTCYVSVDDWKIFDVDTDLTRYIPYQEAMKWRQSNQHKYSAQLMQECKWQNNKVEVLTTKCRQFIYCCSTTSAYFVTQIINQCDDDLLLQSINLLSK